MTYGARLIAAERERQTDEKGYTAAHDAEHHDQSLLHAARSYADEAIARQGRWVNYPHHLDGDPPGEWAWEDEAWRPGDDPVGMLAKAGALIAAEIDRLERRRVGAHAFVVDSHEGPGSCGECGEADDHPSHTSDGSTP